ncbi:Uncharacterized membrane protein [Candidatus Kryptobacter tengchongensis]|uniref:Uncharacterized membrane protein n=1 Tax=Kryptobacter tengchongensis TaxID=1643429 RepID=A0A916LKE8_KRYT1|nr:DUF819 family protein [Candidatus Kryptobacter tengchongensis]CUT03508.1 Uncharacterized membrane protein [Candidatus Kryptobacter tengchongensis]CUU08465.1 Uncharacterized membrane protein [Candidatus Kryptobacter tengchongensis]
MEIFAYLVFLIFIIYRASQINFLSKFFKYLPPVIWVYFLPMLSSAIGIIPRESEFYTWTRTYLLPSALVLLLLSANIPVIVKLGIKAIIMFFAGSFGIIIGGPIVLLIFRHWLPPDAWKGVGALSGSWMGGSATMLAIAQSVGTPESLLAPLIVVDTVVGYGWMGIVIFLSAYQDKVDEFNQVDKTVLIELNKKMQEIKEARKKFLNFVDFTTMIFISFAVGILSLKLGNLLPEIGVIITHYTWGIIIATATGVAMSFTRLSELEHSGSTHVGNFMLYLLLASVGARANVQGIFETPVFMLMGIVWIMIHATCLFIVGRLTKSPMFLMATSSQANIGGPVTAPIVASVYQSALAPVGLLMAVAGNIVGIYGGLLCAQLCYIVSNL